MIRKHLVATNVAKRVTYGGLNGEKYIVIHETANTRKGANANAHARLQASGNSRSASWHYQVDDKEIVQSFDDNKQCWHAGNKYYNQNSIGIEIYVNSDGDYKKAVDNAVKLTKHLMDKYNISANNVIQHNQASGKDCPRYLRAGNKGVTWSQFKAKLVDKTSSNNKTTKSCNSATSAQKSTYKGNCIVDYLKSIGQPSTFSHRKNLASKHGIKNYSGTASQNTRLLNALRGNKTSTKATTTKEYTPRTFKVGQKVKIKSSAKKYSRSNVSIPTKYKNKSLTIQQVGKDDVLIKELYSWVRKSDTY